VKPGQSLHVGFFDRRLKSYSSAWTPKRGEEPVEIDARGGGEGAS
jgi:hypothetical protein